MATLQQKQRQPIYYYTNHAQFDMTTAHSAGHILDFRVEVDRLTGDIPASVQTECTGNGSGLTTQTTQELVLLVLGPTLLNKY